MSGEERLIKLLKKGRESAFEELYQKYSQVLYGICLRYSKNEADAEDLLQDSFIKIYENIKYFKSQGSFEGWLKRITINNCINFYKKTLSKKEISSDEYDVQDSVKEDIFSKLETEEILKLIQGLPEGYRMVFNLYVIEGYKHYEIAEILGISENTSKTQLLKAKKRLMHLLIEKFPGLVEPNDKGDSKVKLVLK
jgi:RNA polymerase sigma-70 factor (ECF subfamily)